MPPKPYMIDPEAKEAPKLKKIFTASSEAFTVLMYDCCFDKWNAMYTYIQEHGALVQKDKENKQHLAIFRSKYTDQDGGQQQYGGWTDAGLEEQSKLTKEVRDARKARPKDIAKLEKDMLECLRVKMKITATNAKTQANNKRNAKRKAGDDVGDDTPKTRAKVAFDFEDDEEEEAGNGE